MSPTTLDSAHKVQPSSAVDASAEERARRLAELSRALEAVYGLCPDLAVLAIRWMHLKHPLQDAQEALLREVDRDDAKERVGGWLSRVRAAISLTWSMARGTLFGAYLALQLIRLRFVTRHARYAVAGQAFDVVARTCCYASTPSADGADFYFGDLQARVARHGIRMLLLCGDATGGKWLPFAEGQSVTRGSHRFPDLALVPSLAPLLIAGHQLRACFLLITRAGGLSDPFARRVASLAARACLSQDTAVTGLLFWVGRTAVKIWHPGAFLTLYEGHAWEACLRAGVKAEDASCATVGYQHTVVFRDSLAMTAPYGRGHNWAVPEVVLGLGEAPLELMRAGHAGFDTRMVRFGSFRYQAGTAGHPADPHRRVVLVTPEGIVSEIRTLFHFALACARCLPSHTFVFRCHPQVPMAQALKLVSGEVRSQPNIVLSEGRRIEEDFARASVLLYRGSSSVMYAVLHGLLPVYLRHGGSDQDPVYGLQVWRRRCATPEEFAELLAEDERVAPMERQQQWDAAARYVKAYTGPVQDDQVRAFLAAMAPHQPGGAAARPEGWLS